jgi:hypothetical protein
MKEVMGWGFDRDYADETIEAKRRKMRNARDGPNRGMPRAAKNPKSRPFSFIVLDSSLHLK